jgi:hypothetical protein
MGVRWSDTQIARRVDHPAFGRTVGSASSTGPGVDREAATGARHPHAVRPSQRALGVRSSARPDPHPSRQLSVSDRVWITVAMVLMLGGMTGLACHHEADGLGCADKHCEVQP